MYHNDQNVVEQELLSSKNYKMPLVDEQRSICDDISMVENESMQYLSYGIQCA
jgi:hypothetical protein